MKKPKTNKKTGKLRKISDNEVRYINFVGEQNRILIFVSDKMKSGFYLLAMAENKKSGIKKECAFIEFLSDYLPDKLSARGHTGK